MKTALAIITQDNKVLIGRLKKEKVADYNGIIYVFPSVQSENNIDKELVNEVKMQSDLDICITGKIGDRVHPITHNATEYYSCETTVNQQIKVSPHADIDEFLWIHPQEIDHYMPSLFEKVKKYITGIEI
jgi:hypothetical protein